MSEQEDDLIQRHLDDRAAPEERSALQDALKESAGLRARYLDYVNLDVTLSALADAAAIGEGTIIEMPVAPRAPFQRWSFAAAAACLAAVCIAGLFMHRRHSPARLDVAATIESARKTIAQMPVPPASPLPEWISPTASMLEPPQGVQ